ncbi:MAG: hypothetical protein WDZ66_00680 [Steroidobacteraceae bacterium]
MATSPGESEDSLRKLHAEIVQLSAVVMLTSKVSVAACADADREAPVSSATSIALIANRESDLMTVAPVQDSQPARIV